jgi:hypothetical protein
MAARHRHLSLRLDLDKDSDDDSDGSGRPQPHEHSAHPRKIINYGDRMVFRPGSSHCNGTVGQKIGLISAKHLMTESRESWLTF